MQQNQSEQTEAEIEEAFAAIFPGQIDALRHMLPGAF